MKNCQLSIVDCRLPKTGAALLEVVFSIAIFVFVAVVILNALNSSMAAANRLVLSAKAADLAVTCLSELEMAGGALQNEGPTPYDEPDQDWTWQVVTAAAQLPPAVPPATQVQVIITYLPTGFSYSIVHIEPDSSGTAATDSSGGASIGGGTP